MSYALYANTDTTRPSGHVFIASEFDTRGTAAVAMNTWTHLATTSDGATLKLYVNGVLASSKAAAGSIKTSAGVLRIGGNSIWGEYFSGLIDEVRIYNRALAASEIQSDMNAAVAAPTAMMSKAVTTSNPVANPARLSLACFPARVAAGSQATCELRLPANGDAAQISIDSSNGAVKVPAAVQARAKQSRLTFTATASAGAAAGEPVTVTAAAGGVSAQDTLVVAPSTAPILRVPGGQLARFGKTLCNSMSRQRTRQARRFNSQRRSFRSARPSTQPAARSNGRRPPTQPGSFVATFAALGATAQVGIAVDSGAPVSTLPPASRAVPARSARSTGKWLSDSTHELSDPSGDSLSLGGTAVKINGEAVAVLRVSRSRVQFLCPTLPAGTPLAAAVTTASAEATPLTTSMQSASPEILSVDAADQTAQPGDELVIQAAGLGSAAALRVELGGAAAEVLSVDAVAGEAEYTRCGCVCRWHRSPARRLPYASW